MSAKHTGGVSEPGADTMRREKRISMITIAGSVVNLLLSVFKVFAGVFAHSAAMIADGIHSLSDLLSDIVVLFSIKMSSKGSDKDHDFGHGKYETFATLIVACMLLAVAGKLIAEGIQSAISIIKGAAVQTPGWLALAAAAISIVSKEILYRLTVVVGKEENSPATIANAWHHRSDALSSVGTFTAIGAAMLFGDKWVILDPLASCVIGVMIIVVAVKMAIPSIQDLLEVSLPEDIENNIIATAESVDGVINLHQLKTRRNGPAIIIDAHLVVDPHETVLRAHEICTNVERALEATLGCETQISLHIEPSEDAE